MNCQRIMWVLWPSFLTAGAAVGVFFSLFDPNELTLFGDPIALSRVAIYSVGFFVFWAFGAASSALTCYLQRGSDEVNKSTLDVR